MLAVLSTRYDDSSKVCDAFCLNWEKSKDLGKNSLAATLQSLDSSISLSAKFLSQVNVFRSNSSIEAEEITCTANSSSKRVLDILKEKLLIEIRVDGNYHEIFLYLYQ